MTTERSSIDECQESQDSLHDYGVAHTYRAMIFGLEFRSMTVVTVMKSHVHNYETCGNITVGIKLGNCGQKAVDR